jgi:hypothetical protein
MTILTELREAFDGDDVPAKNRALRKAHDAIARLEPMSEFILSDDKRGLDFVRWQRSRPSVNRT